MTRKKNQPSDSMLGSADDEPTTESAPNGATQPGEQPSEAPPAESLAAASEPVDPDALRRNTEYMNAAEKLEKLRANRDAFVQQLMNTGPCDFPATPRLTAALAAHEEAKAQVERVRTTLHEASAKATAQRDEIARLTAMPVQGVDEFVQERNLRKSLEGLAATEKAAAAEFAEAEMAALTAARAEDEAQMFQLQQHIQSDEMALYEFASQLSSIIAARLHSHRSLIGREAVLRVAVKGSGNTPGTAQFAMENHVTAAMGGMSARRGGALGALGELEKNLENALLNQSLHFRSIEAAMGRPKPVNTPTGMPGDFPRVA